MTASTIALLGTLRELHTMLPSYDLLRLEELVAQKMPDLLCVEIDREDWESGDLEKAPVESREVLARLSLSSEMTLIPLGTGGRLWAENGVAPPRRGALAAFRHRLFRLLEDMTVGLMKLAGGPRTINSTLVEHLCGGFCHLQVALAEMEAREEWKARNKELLGQILWAVGRDPGRRILVAVDCRRKHWLRGKLRSISDIALVDFWSF